MAVNDQYRPGASKFFSAVPDGTGAPGSPGASEPGPMPDDAYHSAATGVYESVQNRPASSYTVGVGADDANTIGQTREGLSGQNILSTGAGMGNPNPYGHPNAAGRQ